MFETVSLSLEGFKETWRLTTGLIVIICYLYFSMRGISGTGKRQRFFLLLLRSGVVLLMLCILGELSVERNLVAREKTGVALLIDTSRSMKLGAFDRRNSRIQAVSEFLQNNQELLKWLSGNFVPYYYRFDNNVSEISSNSIKNIRAEGEGTDIMHALNYLLARHPGDTLSAVLLFSDGLDTEGIKEMAASEGLDYPLPVFTFSPGSSAMRDTGISGLSSAGFALTGERYSITFNIMMRGWNKLDIPVTLRDENSVLKTSTVSMKDGEVRNVTMEIIPEKAGRHLYTLEVPLYEGDEHPENNRIDFIVNTSRTRLRIILVSGKPSWDLRFLRGVLKSSTRVDLVNFNILRTPADFVNIPEWELSLIPFPSNEIFQTGLDTFDIMILQNFNPEQFVPVSYLKNVVDFVRRGGGLAVIGGSQLARAGLYKNTPLSEVMPASGDTAAADVNFSIKLVEESSGHPLVSIFNENTLNLRELPTLDYLNIVSSVKSWAVPLVVTSEEGRPVLVAGAVEKGRVLLVLTDSLWKYGLPMGVRTEHADIFAEFWDSALRWLSGEPEMNNIIIEPARDNFDTGEDIVVGLKVLDRAYRHVKDEALRIRLEDFRSGRVLEERLIPAGSLKEKMNFEMHEQGSYRIGLEVLKGGVTKDRAEALFIIRGKEGEMESAFTDDELLELISRKTGGRFYSLKERPERLDLRPRFIEKIIGKRNTPVWNHPAVYMAMILLLSLEWYLRRRWWLL